MSYTLQELVVEVWESLGELDQLPIYNATTGAFDVAADGSVKIINALNSAQYAVAAWRDDAKARNFRFRTFYSEGYPSIDVLSGTTPSLAGDSSSVPLAAAEQGQADNYYQGWVVDVEGDTRLVVASDATTLTVASPFAEAVAAGTEYSLTRRWIDVSLTGGVVDVLQVRDMSSDTLLDYGNAGDFFIESLGDVGDPASWYRSGSRVYFNVAPSSSRYFAFQYYRLPNTLVDATDESELPPQFHWAMVLWVLGYWGFAREFEPAMAYSFQRKYETFMKETMNEFELTSFREEGMDVWVEVQ
jgi:hypothetical protein